MKKDSFRDYVMEQLHGLRGLTCAPMFGGYGLRCGWAFFGIISNGRLYFRVSDESLPAFTAARSGPFRTRAGAVMKDFMEVPVNVLENTELAVEWAEVSAAASQATGKGRKRKIRHR